MPDIPGAGFPPRFRDVPAGRVAATAVEAGVAGRVRSVVIGFFRKAADRVVVLQVNQAGLFEFLLVA